MHTARAFVTACSLSIAATGFAQAPSTKSAQGALAYPTKPIRLIAPFAPGGPTDIVARVVSQRLGQQLGQTVVVDNRASAGGAIGCELAAKAAPDGYTLLLGSSGNLAVAPSLTLRLPYDPVRDFQPITQTTSGPQVMVVHPSVQAKTVQDFIALAKNKSGALNYASGGTGMSNHLASELFVMAAKVSIVHVPYKGTGPALTELLGGQVQMMMSSLLPAMPHIQSNRLRALAVTSIKRTAALPEIPTMVESGLPGFETTSWHGVLTQAKVATPLIRRLHDELTKALNHPEVKTLFAHQGMDVVANTPEEFSAYIQHEAKKWSGVIKTIGLKPQ